MQCRSSPSSHEGPPSRCLDPTISVSPSAAGCGGQDIKDPYGINLRSDPSLWCGALLSPQRASIHRAPQAPAGTTSMALGVTGTQNVRTLRTAFRRRFRAVHRSLRAQCQRHMDQCPRRKWDSGTAGALCGGRNRRTWANPARKARTGVQRRAAEHFLPREGASAPCAEVHCAERIDRPLCVKTHGLAGSLDPAALLTRALYKPNNHLTGGIHCTQQKREAVKPNWGFWGNPGSPRHPHPSVHHREQHHDSGRRCSERPTRRTAVSRSQGVDNRGVGSPVV